MPDTCFASTLFLNRFTARRLLRACRRRSALALAHVRCFQGVFERFRRAALGNMLIVGAAFLLA